MNNNIANGAEVHNEDEAAIEEIDQPTNQDLQTVFDELCTELEDIIPEDIFEVIKQARPIETAIMLLWSYGGSIRINNPEVDLKSDYNYPAEAEELNDKVGAFSFTIAKSPFIALTRAASAGINVDEEVIQACELDEYVPLIIRKDDKTKRICLVNYENHKLEVTMDFNMGLDIDMTGNAEEQKAAMDEGLKELSDYLEGLKQHIDDSPKPFDSQEEEDAVMTWCERHGYTVFATFRVSMDRYF